MAAPRKAKWPTAKIGDLCDVCRGSSPRPINDQRYFDGGTIPWIKIADATKSGKYLYETKQYVNKYGASFSRLLPAGTILVAASGTLGYTQILGVPGCAHDGSLILTNLRNLDRDFAYYVLQQMQRHFYNSAYGAEIQNINTETLRETEIPFPPLPTQRQIGSILGAYDDLIENNLRRIRILEEMAQSLYREWFVNFRFPGHERHGPRPASNEACKPIRPNTPGWHPSPLGPIPTGWEVHNLGSACKLVMGQSPKSEFYNTHGNGLPFHQGVTYFGNRFPSTRMFCTVEGRIAEAGDVLFSVRAPVGRINVADRKIVIGRGLSAIRSLTGRQWFLFKRYHRASTSISRRCS
jgi:restriction endonuclease S subunit